MYLILLLLNHYVDAFCEHNGCHCVARLATPRAKVKYLITQTSQPAYYLISLNSNSIPYTPCLLRDGIDTSRLASSGFK
ncbi:hypothetical protein B0H66DRAFT_542379, partial [Apodospora peruviana]